MFVASDLLPTNKMTGKAYLQKEIIHRHITNQRDRTSIPKVKNWSITRCVDHLQANPPPLQEHGFIVAMAQCLIEEIDAHYAGHAGTADASLERLMRLVECMLSPDVRRDYGLGQLCSFVFAYINFTLTDKLLEMIFNFNVFILLH
jgi:hypothetical protein